MRRVVAARRREPPAMIVKRLPGEGTMICIARPVAARIWDTRPSGLAAQTSPW